MWVWPGVGRIANAFQEILAENPSLSTSHALGARTAFVWRLKRDFCERVILVKFCFHYAVLCASHAVLCATRGGVLGNVGGDSNPKDFRMPTKGALRAVIKKATFS